MTKYANKIVSLLKRNRDAVAVLMPPMLARPIADEIYRGHRGADWYRFLRYVNEGGYVGMICGFPLVAAPDAVLCTVNYLELKNYASFRGVDLDLLGEGVLKRLGDDQSN